MEAISTLYYYAAATAALQMNRLRQRGAEKGAMTTTEITGWIVAVLVDRRDRRRRHQGADPEEHRQHEHPVAGGCDATLGRVAGEGLATRCDGVPGDGHRAAGAGAGHLRRHHLRAVVAGAEPRAGRRPTWSGTGPAIAGIRGSGCRRGGRFLTDHGAGGIHDVQVTASLVDGVVQVTVTGTSSEAIPGLAPAVSASAAGPAEPNL